MLKIKCDINQQYFKTVEGLWHFICVETCKYTVLAVHGQYGSLARYNKNEGKPRKENEKEGSSSFLC